MTIHYKIDENDFVQQQLYNASKTDRNKKKRQRNRWLISIVYFVLGLLFILIENKRLGFIFMFLGVIRPLYYPFLEKRRYVKHYKSFFKENCEDSLDSTVTLEFYNDFIIIKANKSESKLHTSEITEINEISTLICIGLKGATSLAIPKNQIIDIESLRNRLKELTSFLKIDYNINENWSWN